MPSLRIVLDPEEAGGIGEEFAQAVRDGTLIHLANDAEIVMSGLADGMSSGKPSVMFGFKLPDGQVVMAETSWWLFATAFWAFAARFGQGDAKGAVFPDGEGKAIEFGKGEQRVRLELQADDAPQWFECELCGARYDATEPGVKGAEQVVAWIADHFEKEHPDWPSPL